MLWFFWGVGAIYLALVYAGYPSNPDQAMFDYVGWVGSNGGRYYIDTIEQNWPGKMVLHEMAFRAFGNHSWTYKLFDFLFMTMLAFTFPRLLGLRLASGYGLLLIAVCQLMYISSGPWFAGQRDIVAGNLMLCLSAVFLYSIGGSGSSSSVNMIARKTSPNLAIKILRGGGGQIAAGMLFAFVVLIRPTYLLFAMFLIPVGIWIRINSGAVLRECLLDILFALGGFAFFLVTISAYGYSTGALQMWISAAIDFNLQVYSEQQARSDTIVRFIGFIRGWSWYIPLFLLGFAVWIKNDKLTPGFFVCIGLLATSLVSAIAQNKGFGYHLGAAFPVISLGVGYAIVTAVKTISTFRGFNIWIAGALLVLALSTFGFAKKLLNNPLELVSGPITTFFQSPGPNLVEWENSNADVFSVVDSLKVAEFVKNTTLEDDRILVWGRHTYIYNFSGRASSTRFFNIGMLTASENGFDAVNHWFNLFKSDLASSPPKLIIFPSIKLSSEGFDGILSANPSRFLTHVRELVATSYKKLDMIGEYEVYLALDR